MQFRNSIAKIAKNAEIGTNYTKSKLSERNHRNKEIPHDSWHDGTREVIKVNKCNCLAVARYN
jgi:hypothetical protein